ncbi:MAG: ATP-binding protein [Ferruginibacter sp.]
MNNPGELNELRELMNVISKSKTTKEVFDSCLIHLTQSQIFRFQFAVINLIDPFSKTVNSWIPSPNHIPELGHEHWRDAEVSGESIYKLYDKDIVLIVAKNNCIIEVVGNSINFIEGSSDDSPILDHRLYNSFNHDRLTRIFMPLLDTSAEGEFFSFGVIEMGFITAQSQFEINSDLITKIKIYLNHCVQIYHHIYVVEETKRIEDQVIKPLRSIKDHQNYLKRIIEGLVRYFNCDRGEIDIISLDENEHDWLSSKSESKKYDIKDNDVDQITFLHGSNEKALTQEEVRRKVFEEKEPFYAPVLQANSDYDNTKLASQFFIPFSNNDKTIGVLNLYSEYPNYFDKLKRASIIGITTQICDIYFRKKTLYLLGKLVLPLNIFGEKKEVFKNTIEIINEYFVGGNIAVYIERSEKESQGIKYQLDEHNKIIQKKVAVNQKWNATDDIRIEKKGKVLSVKAVLSIGKKQKKNYGYIEISTSRLVEISDDDKIFLSQCSSKLAITLYFIDLFQAFFAMPTSLAMGKIEEVYRAIEESAKDLFDAKPVSIIQFDNENKFSLQRLTGSEDLYFSIEGEEARGNKDDPNMAVEVLKHKEIYVTNPDEYLEKWRAEKRGWRTGYFSEDFYVREEIVSFASVLLEHNGEPLGAIFLNYRDERFVSGFDEDFKSQLKTFGILSSQAIAYAKLLAENRSIRSKNFLANKPFVDSLILLGLIHGIENEAQASKDVLDDFINRVSSRKLPDELRKEELKKWLEEELLVVQKPINALHKSLANFRSFRNSKGEKFVFVDKLLSDLIDETVSLVRSKIELEEIRIDWKSELNKKLVVNVDTNSVKHILVNLLYNAIEAISDQKNWRRREIRIESEVKGDFVYIKVSDSGPGISEQVRSTLFESYVTTKKYGTGMGLGISKYLAEINKGKIDFEERPSEKGGVWTSFILKLPVKNN